MLDDVNGLYVVLLFVCLLLSAFFSSSETAFISLQRIRMKHLEKVKVAGADRVARIMERPERFLTTILLGNTVTNTLVAVLGTAIAVSLWGEGTAVLITTTSVALALLIFAEITPKTIATRHSERVALLYARPVRLILALLSPLVLVLGWIGSGLAKLIGGTPEPQTLVTEDEIRTMISLGKEEGVVEEAEARMLHEVFEFGHHAVREAMTPRTDIISIEQGTTLGQFLQTYSQTPHSRFPVYQGTTDNVVGVLSIKDVLVAQAQSAIDRDDSLEGLIRPLAFVPDSKRIGELFAEMQSRGDQMTMVVDEFGGVDGVVTMEQLLEEIVGQIRDELAPGRMPEFETIDEHTFDIDGNMRAEEASEELGLELPPGEYETVAGFVLSLLGHIPKEGEQVRHENFKLVVTRMRGMRIEKLRVTKERDEDLEHQANA
jgi:putative hemolysin